jgi:hypothetical protein
VTTDPGSAIKIIGNPLNAGEISLPSSFASGGFDNQIGVAMDNI